MTELKKGSSKPECEDTLLGQICREITPEQIYKEGSVVLKGAKMENVTVFESLQQGDFLVHDGTALQQWNYRFTGCGQIVIPKNDDKSIKPVNFEGYAEVKDGMCEKICNVITIKD